MRRFAAAAGVSICLAAATAGLVGCGEGGDESAGKQPLLCYVGGTMRPVMEKLVKDYEQQTGVKVQIDSAGSGELLDRIAAQKRGDLYVCHDPFQERLRRGGLSVRGWTLAVVTPTIVVQKGNRKKIRSVKDLAATGLKLAMTHPTHSTTGWIVPRVFDKAGLRKQIEANIVKRTRGGGSAANLVAMDDVDAAIVWDAVAHLRRDKLDAVPIEPQYRPIPGIDVVTSPTARSYDIGRIKVTMDVLTCSKQPEAATKFAEFVVSKQNVFAEEFGFTPAPAGAAGQFLYIHCGAGIRYAMEDAAAAFERKTGAKLTVGYAGGGTLITTIKLKEQGDLYMPGDVFYVEQLEKEGAVVSKKLITYFVPVIIVPKGNPKKVKTLADLVRPGMRLGVGNPKACQIGRMTRRIFARNQIDLAAVRERTIFSSVTVNELGVKVRTDAIDAAIVWDAVAANFARDVEVVKIPLQQNLISRVAIGILKFSRDRPLAERFVSFLAGEEGKAIFAGHGYTVEEPK